MKQKNKKIEVAIKSIAFLFIIFCPVIRFLPKYSWILAFCGLALLINKRFRKQIGVTTNASLVLWVMIIVNVFVLGLLVPTIHSTSDYSYVPLLIGVVLAMLRCLLLTYIACTTDREFPLDCFIRLFLNACCIYVGFTILFIIFPSVRSFWLYTVLEGVTEQSYYAYQFRYSFDGFAAFSSASIFSFSSLLAGYIIAKKKKYEAADLFRMIVCVVGCFFYGRIALVGIILGVFIVLSHNNSTKKLFKIIWRAILIIVILVFIVNYLASIDDRFLYWKQWAFSIVEQLFVDKKITDYSVTHMIEDMYYFPDDIKTFLIGDGYYTNQYGAGYYGSTDVGFMRIMLYSGVPGLLLSYSTILYCVHLAMCKSKDLLTKKFLWCFLVLWMILECKGESYHRMIVMIYPLLLVLTYEKGLKNDSSMNRSTYI